MSRGNPKRGEVKMDYLHGIGIAELSEKYAIPYNTVDSWIRRYKWDDERKFIARTLHEKTLKKVVEQESSRLAKAYRISFNVQENFLSIINKKIVIEQKDGTFLPNLDLEFVEIKLGQQAAEAIIKEIERLFGIQNPSSKEESSNKTIVSGVKSIR